MAEIVLKVKEEKIDPEIEEKIKQHINVKKEPPDGGIAPQNPIKTEQNSSDSNSSTDSNDDAEAHQEEEEEGDEREEGETAADDKKNIEVAKSSNELLAELFQVFNAAPPEELLNDENLLKKARHKKHKKEKKKKRKKDKDKDVGSVGVGSELVDCVEDIIKKEKHKHKKKKKYKSKEDGEIKVTKIKEEKESKPPRTRTRSKSKDKEKAELRRKSSLEIGHKSKDDNDNKESKAAAAATLNKSSSSSKKDLDDVRLKHVVGNGNGGKRHTTATAADNKSEPPAKRRLVNSFYNGRDEERDLSRRLTSNDDRSRSRRRHRSNSKEYLDNNDISDISLSDEETYLRERQRQPHGSSATTEDDRHRRRRRQSYQSAKQRSRSRRPPFDSYRRRRSRSRSSKRRSGSRDLGIDKKRLLEIARKNAISMFKRGNLPGCANMSEDVKDKVLLQMRYGGRTVQDLTDFCKKISNGEPLSSMSSEDNDSDVDKCGNTKAFHHPFQLKERNPIVLHFGNSKPIPPPPSMTTKTTEDQSKAITLQFPVSSGQQHRISENWMEVVEPPSKPPLPLTLPKISTPAQWKNVFEKPLPIAEVQEPAFKPVGGSVVNSETNSENAATAAEATKTPLTNAESNVVTSSSSQPSAITTPQPVQPPSSNGFVPDVPIPSSSSSNTLSNSVFPEFNATASFDVSNIISKRLNALRRLQENPKDTEAIQLMNNSQKEMSSWASSKHVPGKFTGSTGVNILKVHELNSGPQCWARRDQLTSTKPVTGGMGMHLLQKMGWKPGEGLGREKTGTLQPLLLDVKLDKRGLVAKEDVGAGRYPIGGNGTNKKRAAPSSLQDAMQNLQNKHPVSILNELCSKRKLMPPLYELVSEGGPSHSKKFLFSVVMNGQTYTPKEGSNTKKEAKMVAAKYCLEQIGILPILPPK